MDFTARLDNQISPSARAATADLQALKGALGDVSKALGGMGSQTPKDAVPKAADTDKATGDKKAKEKSKLADSLKQGAGKAAGGIEVPIKWVAAAAGVAGFAGLAKIAMGYAGMAKLQALGFQTQMNFRQLFKGVDPSPVLRAFTAFSKNLSGQTVTGRALGDVLTRAFNGIFGLLEKIEPIASAAFQGMVIGALYAEQGILKAEIALAPYIVAIEDAAGSTDMMEAAAVLGAIAVGALGVAATIAAAPFIAIGAAISTTLAAFRQLIKLRKEWDESSFGQIKAKLGQDLGFTSQEDAEKALQLKAQGNYERQQARNAAESPSGKPAGPVPAASPDVTKAAGNTAGKALGMGLVEGMDSTAAAVGAAGGKLADAATKGVRDKAEIHSPSRVMARDGRYMGEGVEQGIDASAPGVQAAADRSLVPQVEGKPSGASASKSAASIVMHNVFQITGGNLEETKQAVLEALNEIMFSAKVQAGVPDEVRP